MKANLYTDGGARGNPGPAGTGYVLEMGDGRKIEEGEYIGDATNNQAEYQALTKGLARAQAEGVQEINVFMDSELIVKQVKGEYRVKNGALKELFAGVKQLLENFKHFSFQHIPREKNKQADKLVNEAIDKIGYL